MPASRKLCLIVVDSLRTDMLLRAVADDLAPNFAALIAFGGLVLAGFSLLVPPVSLLALAGLLWLWASRQRHEARKYEGLRSLR